MANPNETQTDKFSLPAGIKYTISAVICLVGIASMYLLYQLRESPGKKESDALIPLVDTSAVQIFEGDLDLVASGTVVPFREIRVGAQVSGRIAVKYPECEAGNYVSKGTVLLKIDPSDYELEIKTMNSEIVQAERTMDETDEEIRGANDSLEIAKTEMKLQLADFRRFEKLKRSVSPSEFDQAKRASLTSESQLVLRQNTVEMLLKKKDRLNASMDLIENRLEKAQLNLSRTTVSAPVDGVIVRETVEQGDFVAVSNELLVFEDTKQSEVLCHLTPGELNWLRKYAESEMDPDPSTHAKQVYQLPRVDVEIFEQSDSTIKWQGVLERFDGIGRNETTKSIPCRIVIKDPVVDTNAGKRVLVRGMYVKCRIVLPNSNTQSELAAFPSIAVRPGDYVWVVRDSKLKRFDVNVIDRSPYRESLSSEKMVVIELAHSGISIGDRVVISPLPQPTDGGRVLLKEKQKRTAENMRRNEVKSSVNSVQSDKNASDAHTKTSRQAGAMQDRGKP